MENIQTKYAELLKSSCYAFCLCYVFSGTTNEWKWLELISKGVQNGDITEDCYVQKPLDFIKMLCGTEYKDVKKPLIDSLDDLPNDNYHIVEYRWGTKQHFVVANSSGIIFDSSGDSNTVKNGKPFSYRLFIK